MRTQDFATTAYIAVTLLAAASAAFGQDYPGKAIRIVAPEAGGGADFAARLIALGLSASLGQQVIVDNRGGGVIPGEVVAKAAPDGHTLLYHGSSLWLMPFLRDNLPWDPVRDFAPVTLAVIYPNLIVVHPSLPVNSVRDLIALAHARPGELNYASGVPGSSPQLAAEMFKAMARADIAGINYRGAGPAIIALMSGQVHLSFSNAGAVAPHLKTGRLRALAITSAQPSALFPGLPTVAGAGLPGYESVAMSGMFAPARTPAAIVNRLHREIARELNKPEVRERFATAGVETVGSTPEQFAATIKSEMARMGKVIRYAKIRAE